MDDIFSKSHLLGDLKFDFNYGTSINKRFEKLDGRGVYHYGKRFFTSFILTSWIQNLVKITIGDNLLPAFHWT